MTARRPAGTWSALLWQEMEPIYDAILTHQFLTELADGSLDPAVFAHYIVQDVHYLRGYARALAVLGAKAATHTDTAMLVQHAAGAVDAELALHATLLPALHLNPGAVGAIAVAPTTRAYIDYLLATVHTGSFAEGLASVLPCYWIYAQVGTALVQRGSPDQRYQRWIDTYADDEFTTLVEKVLELVDRVGTTLGPDERHRAAEHLGVTARYEWMFWDAAHRLEQWPI